MNILINASNLKQGGGIQVADSVCHQLVFYIRHHFVVLLPPCMETTVKAICSYDNCDVIIYDMFHTKRLILFGRDDFADNLVDDKKIDVVLSIFGPVMWIPKVKHVCGFARGHIVLEDTPYYTQMPWLKRTKEHIQNQILKYFFKRSADTFFTENPFITDRLSKLLPSKRIVTISNYYNQVFDEPEKQVEHTLPKFDGVSLVSINTPYPHKNMDIALEAAKLLKVQHPEFKFRFVMTAKESDFVYDFSNDSDAIAENFCLIGKVNVNECPSLYRQCDFTFQSTLMECFTATYCEGMRMEKPIITTDLTFARGLCGNAAIYYEAIDAKSCAETIYKLVQDKELQKTLVEEGKRQLAIFDNYIERARKMIALCEEKFV